VLVGVFLFIAGFSIYNGLKQGTALFSMADVEYLFTAPVNPRTILLSGIAKQASIMIFASIFLLFQYSNIRRLAGLDVMALVGLMVSYAILGISLHILSACLYAYSSAVPGAAQTHRHLVFGSARGNAGIIRADIHAAGRIDTTGADGILRIGCLELRTRHRMGAGFGDRDHGIRFMSAIIYLALMLLSAVGFTMLLQRTDMDYFEDVLLAAERASQAKEDKKAGRVSEQGAVG
jgi:hypothetical protein